MPDESRPLSHNGTDAAELHVLTDLAALERWRLAWQALDQCAAGRNGFFQSYAWCHGWMQAHGSDHSAHVLLIARGGQAQVIWPLMRDRAFGGVKLLRALGEPHSQYSTILTRAAQLSEEDRLLLIQGLAQSGADAAVINYVPQDSALHGLLPAESRARQLDNLSSQFDLSGFTKPQDYVAWMSKRQRLLRRRAETFFKPQGGLSMRVLHPGTEAFSEAAQHCIALKRVWIEKTGRINDGLDYPGHAGFLSSLAGPRECGRAIMFSMGTANRTIAYQIGFAHQGHYYLYTAGFDWHFRGLSPGAVLIDYVNEWLAAEGFHTFDLMGNRSGYKEQFCNKPLPLTGHILNLTWKGRVYSGLWSRRLRPAAKMMFHALPVSVRHAINRLRAKPQH
ncbi:MAG: GNAT family N-acetyltransferase [Hyphomicrobiales bacterium]